ncbi:MAG TPA: CoA pyrophosphatase [Hyphomicrobiales bacterium]|nr:CoA pyrophosphatase [Hyphomicrobiales bacterium]
MSGVAVKPNPVFTGAEFVMRARARLSPLPFEAPPSQGVAGLRGDHIMNPMSTPSPRRLAQLRSAAVLVPVMVREGEATLLLTQRTEELPAHAGQVAFPGGKVEEEDETPLHAALREAQEEIGLPPDHAEPLGYLRPYHTTSGFKVIPVVAAVTPGFDIVPDESEVAAVFEVPLSFLMNPANHQRHSRIWRGMRRFFFAMPYENRYIWGITAGIIRELYDEVYRA